MLGSVAELCTESRLWKFEQQESEVLTPEHMKCFLWFRVLRGAVAHPQMRVCLLQGFIELHNLVMKDGDGKKGEKTPASPPLSNKEVMFQWEATINLDTGTQALIDLIPRCPVFSEVAAKNLHLPS